MGAQLQGADLEGLENLSRAFDRQAAMMRTLTNTATQGATELATRWEGPDSAQFRQLWMSRHRPLLLRAADELTAAAETVRRNRDQQSLTSEADLGAGGPGAAALLGPSGLPLAVTGLDQVRDFLFGEIANLWSWSPDEGFPVGQVGAGLLRVMRTGWWLSNGMPDELFPTFNTGFIGSRLAAGLERIPALSRYGSWLSSPAATTALRRLGVAGGIYGTASGLYNIYQQGNPIDAFQENPAGYVGDWANTAFSASTTAFLLAPSPLTAGLVIGTGLVWAGAEVVENWDEITEWTSNAWDATSDFVGSGWDAGVDIASDTFDVGADLASDAWDAGSDFVSDGVGTLASAADPRNWF